MDSSELEKCLETLSAKLSATNIAAGDNIELTQTQDALTISSSASDFTSKFKRWLMNANDRLGKPELVAGRNVSFERSQDSIVINAEVAASQASGKALVRSAADYPFKVEIAKDAVLVHGFNEKAGRYFRDYATFGLTRLEIAEKSFETLSSDSWLYLEAGYDAADGYKAEVKSASEIPAQTDSLYIVPIAFVKTKDGAPSEVFQMQYGPIEGAGRIF